MYSLTCVVHKTIEIVSYYNLLPQKIVFAVLKQFLNHQIIDAYINLTTIDKNLNEISTFMKNWLHHKTRYALINAVFYPRRALWWSQDFDRWHLARSSLLWWTLLDGDAIKRYQTYTALSLPVTAWTWHLFICRDYFNLACFCRNDLHT